MLSRRSMLTMIPAVFEGLGPGGSLSTPGTGARRVAVVFPSALEPCAEAVNGLRAGAGDAIGLDLLDLSATAFDGHMTREISRKPGAFVAVGSEALRAVLARNTLAKTISTMTLQADRDAGTIRSGRMAAAVYLDIPVRTLVAAVRALFPGKARFGVIRNPRRDPEVAMDSVESADCSTADGLLPVFLWFRKRVDFVICLPDGSLYNSATARPLIMASLENRLPVVGFSPAFLRAGAAVAIYPDYTAIGRQTADLLRHCLEPGDCTAWEYPRKVDVAVNAKILRMLGLEFKADANPGLVILR